MSSVSMVVNPLFKNILFTTDFSESSEVAVPFVRAMAQLHGSTVHILHVSDADAPGELIPDIEVEDKVELSRKMEALASSCAFEGVTHTASIRPGAIWDVVSEVIRELHIDLVVVGTHGEHGLKQFILGSTAEQILRSAPCPVLTVGPETRKQGLADGRISEILYPTDFSAASDQAFPYALNLARASNAELTLLHAVDPDDVTEDQLDQAVEDAKQRLSSLIKNHPVLRARIAIERGSAEDIILSKATQLAADLIVMGAHGGVVAAHLPWKVVRQVVCHAQCPVLTYRGSNSL